jgi:hypothetical protein
MTLEAKVNIEGGVADYHILPEGNGLYRADLVGYHGRPNFCPAERIIMVRSVRKWIGSCDHIEVINQIGREIEKAVHEAPIFRPGTERNYNRFDSPEQ